MIQWLRRYKESSSQTQYFILNWILYLIMIIASTLYVYIRLDYVRSYRTPPPTSVEATSHNVELSPSSFLQKSCKLYSLRKILSQREKRLLVEENQQS